MPARAPATQPVDPATIDWTKPGAYRLHASQRLLPIPDEPAAHLTLYTLRRMVGHGLHDAQASSRMLAAFGLPFQRPLVLLRALVWELNRSARRKIILAPCCCPRMTLDEARLLATLRHARLDEPRAARHLTRLTGTRMAAGALCAATAYSWALADLGNPFE